MKKFIRISLSILFFVSMLTFLMAVAHDKVAHNTNPFIIYIPFAYLFIFPVFMFWDKQTKKHKL